MRPLLACLACVLLALTPGCLHLEQVVQIKENGEATFIYHYSVPSNALPALAEGQRAVQRWQNGTAPTDGRGPNWFFNERAVRRHFTGRGMRTVRFRSYTDAGRKHAYFEVEAKRLRRALDSEKHGRFILTRDAGGDATLRLDLMAGALPADPTAKQLDVWRALLAGLRIALVIETPGPISRTTGRKLSPRRVAWVFDADEDPMFITKLPVVELTYAATPPQEDGAAVTPPSEP